MRDVCCPFAAHRPGIGLRWDDVDLDRGTVSVQQTLQRVKGKGLVPQPPKTRSGLRRIAIDDGTVAMLREHRARQNERRLLLGDEYRAPGLVFTNTMGGALDGSNASKIFDRLRRRVGVPEVTLHKLRHYHASLLLRANENAKVVQNRLGHATVGMTLDTYSHLIPGYDAPAAEAVGDAMRKLLEP